MIVKSPEPTLTITLNIKEIKWLRDASQNSEIGEPEDQSKIRLAFFVASARALGYEMNDDGSANRDLTSLKI